MTISTANTRRENTCREYTTVGSLLYRARQHTGSGVTTRTAHTGSRR